MSNGVAVAAPADVRARLGVRTELIVLAGVLALGAALRFVDLGLQSFWYDESVTASIIRHPLGTVLDAIPRTESTPPLYYILAWAWSQLFGSDEVGVRSLSALVGTATIPIVWLAGRRLISSVVGLLAAALVAVNPILVWYSQEARAYALVVFLGALSFLLFVRARERATAGRLAAWAVACALALATHYFAVFLVIPEIVWLAWSVRRRGRRRAFVIATGGVVAVGVALLPLAVHQERAGRTAWIAASDLGGRVSDVARELWSGNTDLISSGSPAPHGPWGAIGFLLFCTGVALFGWAAIRRSLAGGWIAAGVGSAALIVPLVLAFTPLDYFKDRNLIAAWVPLVIAWAAGAGAPGRTRPLGILTAVALCGAGLVIDVQVTRDTDLQRADWRGLIRTLGPATAARVLAVQPAYAATTLAVYGHPTVSLLPGARVAEIDALGELPSTTPPATAPNGFRLVERRRVQQLWLWRYRRPEAVTFTPRLLASGGIPVVLEASQSAERWLTQVSAQVSTWRQAAARVASARGSIPADVRAELSNAPITIAKLSHAPPELPWASTLYRRLTTAAQAARQLAFANPSNRAPPLEAFEALIAQLTHL